MARGCGCGGTVSCQKVKDCVEDWAPGAASAATSVPTVCPTTDLYKVPVVLASTTSTGGSAEVVDDGGGNLRLVRPGLWQVTALLRFNAGASNAAVMYGEILGADAEAWYATSIPVTSNAGPYSVGTTVVGAVTVAADSSAVVSANGRRSYYAVNAQITSVTMSFKRLAPTASPPGQDAAERGASGTEAEIARELAQLAAEA